jgi:predicted phage terminase large subunit-like protein
LNGAEILFRSAKEPERLRGPNLAGAWLDECQLMDEEVFDIVLGRLRQSEQGNFLTATFTPRGKQHWTYLKFATGTYDTVIFRARTEDNVFIGDRSYAPRLRMMYGSAKAAQEVGGEFIDIEGSLFRRHWFPIVETAPSKGKLCRFWDQAATEAGGCYSAGVLMCRAEDSLFYVLSVARGQWSPFKRDQMILQTARMDKEKYGRVETGFECEPGSAGIESAQNKVNMLAGFSAYHERPTGTKEERADGFRSQAEGGNVRLLRGPWNQEYLDEISVFPEGKYADQVDASSGAFKRVVGVRLRIEPWLEKWSGSTRNGRQWGEAMPMAEAEIEKLVNSGALRL